MTQRQKLPEWLLNMFSFGRSTFEQAKTAVDAGATKMLEKASETIASKIAPFYQRFEEKLSDTIAKLSGSVSDQATKSFEVIGEEVSGKLQDLVENAKDENGDVVLEATGDTAEDKLLQEVIAETPAAEI